MLKQEKIIHIDDHKSYGLLIGNIYESIKVEVGIYKRKQARKKERS